MTNILGKEDQSLYMYVKNVVLRDFVETEQLVPLKLLADVSSSGSYVYEAVTEMIPSPVERGRGWVYFDEPDFNEFCAPYTTVSGLNGDGDSVYGIPEQSDRVTLYNSNGTVEVPWQDYMIDYLDGRIVIPYKLAGPKVTYAWNYVSVVDEWSAVQASAPPIVAIELRDTVKNGYQLGGGKKSTRTVDVHIFASNQAEKNDLKEVLHDGFYNRSCRLYEFPTGSVLDFDGTFYGRRDLEDRIPNPADKTTYLFDATEVSGTGRILFKSVRTRDVSPSLTISRGVGNALLTDINAHRAKVSFEMVVYDDRVIN